MLCAFCQESDLLCRACQASVEKGTISRVQLALFREVTRLRKTLPRFRRVQINRVFEYPEALVLVCSPSSMHLLVGRGGKQVQELSKKIGKPVHLVPETNDRDQLLTTLVRPGTVEQVSMLYTKGSQQLRVRVSRKPLLLKSVTIKKIAKQVMGLDIELVRS
ncbi:MAG: hypothetical protein KKA90_02795 [Nanoarchaeota archaeon]|nr:hypothetical protein [Nanoarchaeota archaeon]